MFAFFVVGVVRSPLVILKNKHEIYSALFFKHETSSRPSKGCPNSRAP